VWLWLEFQAALVDEERGRVLRMFAPGGDIVVEAPRAHQSRFIGLTRGEVEEFFDTHRGQLELLAMFELLAITEAILRIEFKARMAGRKKDGLSRRFREIHKANGEKIRLDEDILVAMKEEGVRAAGATCQSRPEPAMPPDWPGRRQAHHRRRRSIS
jgi:hypothetical protein